MRKSGAVAVQGDGVGGVGLQLDRIAAGGGRRVDHGQRPLQAAVVVAAEARRSRTADGPGRSCGRRSRLMTPLPLEGRGRGWGAAGDSAGAMSPPTRPLRGHPPLRGRDGCALHRPSTSPAPRPPGRRPRPPSPDRAAARGSGRTRRRRPAGRARRSGRRSRAGGGPGCSGPGCRSPRAFSAAITSARVVPAASKSISTVIRCSAGSDHGGRAAIRTSGASGASAVS